MMNDASVRSIGTKTVLQQKAYILFYQRVVRTAKQAMTKDLHPVTAAQGNPAQPDTGKGGK